MTHKITQINIIIFATTKSLGNFYYCKMLNIQRLRPNIFNFKTQTFDCSNRSRETEDLINE